MANVDIYTKEYCPYCVRAKSLLQQKSVAFNEIKIDGNSELRSAMIERSQGGYTVPQIFINDTHIGGCDQLLELEYSQQLDTLLAEQASA